MTLTKLFNRILFCGLFLVAPFQLQAASGEKTPFQEIGERFTFDSRLPQSSQILGWWTGRCFEWHSPSQARNSLLVVQQESVGSENGPLFPPTTKNRFFPISIEEESADYFDSLDSKKLSNIALLAESRAAAFSFEEVVMIRDGVRVREVLEARQFDFWGALERTFYLAEQKTSETHYLYLRLVPARVGKVTRHCYYFQQVK
jgi:hypothetical protein